MSILELQSVGLQLHIQIVSALRAHKIYLVHNLEKLWRDTDEKWDRIYRGLEKTELKNLMKVALIFAPESRDYHTLNKFTFFYSYLMQLIFLYTGAVTLSKASVNLILFVEIAHYYLILIGIHITISQHYVFKLRKFRQVFESMDEDIFDYGTDFDRDEMENHRFRTVYYMKFLKVVLKILLAVVGITLILLPLFRISKGIEMIYEGINSSLPVPFWFPFSTETPSGFVFAYFLEINMIIIIMMYLVTYIPFLIQMMIEIISHLRVLNHSINKIELRASAMYNSYSELAERPPGTSQENDLKNELYEFCYSDCLRRNIFHHKSILKFIDLFQDINSTLFGVLLGTNMLVIAAITIVITKVQLFSVDFYKFFLLMLIELVNVFIYCFLGTFITEEAKTIGDSIYNTPWPRSSKTTQNLVKFIQLRVTHVVVLKGNGMITLSLQLYIQIMQTAYSIFNLFSSFET